MHSGENFEYFGTPQALVRPSYKLCSNPTPFDGQAPNSADDFIMDDDDDDIFATEMITDGIHANEAKFEVLVKFKNKVSIIVC